MASVMRGRSWLPWSSLALTMLQGWMRRAGASGCAAGVTEGLPLPCGEHQRQGWHSTPTVQRVLSLAGFQRCKGRAPGRLQAMLYAVCQFVTAYTVSSSSLCPGGVHLIGGRVKCMLMVLQALWGP